MIDCFLKVYISFFVIDPDHTFDRFLSLEKISPEIKPQIKIRKLRL
jgi:hypothetical protein